MIEIEQLNRNFGGLMALKDISLSVEPGEVFGVIGPNGSGKTTLLNIITGVYPPSDGHIRLVGQDTSNLSPHHIARLGVARTYQNLRLYQRMTVVENIRGAGPAKLDGGTWKMFFPDREAERERRLAVEQLLEKTGLIDRRHMLAKNLPLADQRRLELARALAGDPQLLLLDEPAGGMTPAETEEMTRLIRDVATPGRTCLVVEHKMDMITALCGRICVLDFGSKIAEGPPHQVLADDAVRRVYLGEDGTGDA